MSGDSGGPLVSLLAEDETTPEVRELLADGAARYGTVLETWRALANRPEIFLAYMPYLRSIVGPGSLDQRLKELVEVRTVVLARCLYSTSHRVRSALAAGVSEADLVAVARGELEGFGERERLALELCERLTLDPSLIPYAEAPQLVGEEMLDGLKGAFSDPEIVELVATIGLWNALARFHRVMGLELDMEPPPAAIAAEL